VAERTGTSPESVRGYLKQSEMGPVVGAGIETAFAAPDGEQNFVRHAKNKRTVINSATNPTPNLRRIRKSVRPARTGFRLQILLVENTRAILLPRRCMNSINAAQQQTGQQSAQGDGHERPFP